MEFSSADFLRELDSLYAQDREKEAEEYLKYWQIKARDAGGALLITVLNEAMGFAREHGDEKWAMLCVKDCLETVENAPEMGAALGTVYINIANTMGRFKRLEESIDYYEKAERTLLENGAPAQLVCGLLNNKAGTYIALGRYDDSVDHFKRAYALASENEAMRMERAVSCANLSDLLRRLGREEESLEYLGIMRAVLDDAAFPRDATYAAACYKCAPVYSRRGDERSGNELIDRAEAIYARNRGQGV